MLPLIQCCCASEARRQLPNYQGGGAQWCKIRGSVLTLWLNSEIGLWRSGASPAQALFTHTFPSPEC